MPSDNRDFSHVYNVMVMVVVCVPAWIRFAQCMRRYMDTKNKFPHLANAFKYFTFFVDTVALVLRYRFSQKYGHKDWENPFFYVWFLVRLCTTSYKLWWDYKMDWGFFDKDAGENRFLREVCVYPSKVSISNRVRLFHVYMIQFLQGLLLFRNNRKPCLAFHLARSALLFANGSGC